MLKSFLLKQLLKSKLKDIPEADQQKILSVIEKNPDFFMTIAKKVEEKTKLGMDQMSAIQSVMEENESELKKIIS